MQKLKQYLREVIIGGIYLIFPLTLLVYVASVAHDFVAFLIKPLSNVMPYPLLHCTSCSELGDASSCS